MSTVQKVNFEPVSNLLQVQTRDFPLVDPDLANPFNAACLVDGEWMAVNSDYKLVRASDIATPAAAATLLSYPLWAERGRYDVQAMGERKMPVIYLNGAWEFDTRIFDATSMTHNCRVAVATITIGSRNYSGLVYNGTIAAPGAGITVGFVTRLPNSNGGKLRIRGGALY